MAKEKFERTKPHVNIGDRIKGMFGLGKGPEEPPIEPYEEEGSADETTTAGFAEVGGLGPTTEVVEHRDGGPPEAHVMFNPSEIEVQKSVPWNEGDESDTDGKNDFRFIKSRSGHRLDAGDDEAVADEAEAEPEGDAAVPTDDMGRYKVKLPFDGPGEEDDPAFELRSDADGSAQIRFGDGEHGRVPPAGSTSPGGGGSNEIKMDDSDGAQEGPVPMPYPNTTGEVGSPVQDASPEHDATLSVYHDRTEDTGVGANQTETVGSNETQDVGDSAALGDHIGAFNFKVEIEGVTGDVKEGGLNDYTHKMPSSPEDSAETAQYNQTDMEFLNERAARPGFDDAAGGQGAQLDAAGVPPNDDSYHDPQSFQILSAGQDGPVGQQSDPDEPSLTGQPGTEETADQWRTNAFKVEAGNMPTEDAGTPEAGLSLPEPGDEVLVEFEQGDPDQPVVTGRLWNGQDAPPEAPPTELPGAKTISGLKTDTVPGDDGGDEEESTLAEIAPTAEMTSLDEGDVLDVDDPDLDDIDPDLDS